MNIKDWIPVFKEVVWPIFFFSLILLFRKKMSPLLEAIKKKIEEKGSQVEIGKWLKITSLRQEDEAVKKELDSVKNSINNELKKENPDYKSMERLFNLHQTLESNREELASELRESILHKPLSPVKEESKRIDVAIVIGHKKTSPGVVNSKTSISEFEYNEGISILIERYLTKLEITAERVYRRTFSELPDDINKLNPVVMISLHANALNGQLSGSEVLYLADSESGMKLAKLMLKKIVDALALPDRGIKGITPQDRGGYLLNNTRSTSIIMEPFFMDNDSDVSTAIQKKEELANAIALGLNEYITTIR